VQPDWLQRYGHRAEEYRFPTSEEKRQQFRHQVGQDGWRLLAAMEADPASQWMLAIPAVDTDASRLERRLPATGQRRRVDS
jgi:transposase